MNPAKSWHIALAAGLLAGLLAGYSLGWSARPPGQLAQTPSSAPQGPENQRANFGSRWQEDDADFTPQPARPTPLSNPRPITASELRNFFQTAQKGKSLGFEATTLIAGLEERLKVSDLEKLLDELMKDGPVNAGRGGFFFVANYFAQSNPRAAWEYAINLPPGQIREHMVATAAQALGAADPNSALALAKSVADHSLRIRLRNSALMRLAAKNPRQAAQIAATNGESQDLSLSFIYMQWAQSDPKAAWEEALKLEGQKGQQATTAVLNTLAQQDPKKAWELASKVPDLAPEITENLVRVWSESDPSSALRAAESMRPGSAKSRAIGAALQSLSRQNLRAATNYVIGVADPILRSDLFQQLSMGQVSEPEFLFTTLLQKMPPGSNFQTATSNLLRAWAVQDPQAAAKAIRQLPPGQALSSAASQVASIWSSSGKADEALAWAKSLPQGHARVAAVESILREVADKNPRKALEMARGLPEKEYREALREIGRAWSRRSPHETLQWASQLSDTNVRSEVMRSAITQWAQESPVEAAAYAAKLPEAERARALQGAIERWAARDAESAAQWLQRLPSSPSKDGAQAALARQIATEDPETALAWATQLHDQNFRQRTTEQIARDWLRQEPEAARTWIARSQLPEEIRSRLLK